MHSSGTLLNVLTSIKRRTAGWRIASVTRAVSSLGSVLPPAEPTLGGDSDEEDRLTLVYETAVALCVGCTRSDAGTVATLPMNDCACSGRWRPVQSEFSRSSRRHPRAISGDTLVA